MAVAARVRNRRTRTLAGRAGLLNREEALLHANLSRASTGRARNGFAALPRAAAAASVAADLGRDVDRHVIPSHGSFEIQLELVAEICTTKDLRSPPATPAAEDIAKHVAKDVAESLGAEPAAGASAHLQGIMAEPVVG